MTATLPPRVSVPLLENGAHLDSAEFERRYQAMPHVNKAELIEGVVYMPSPVRASVHGTPHARIQWWLTHYSVFTPSVQVADNATVRLDRTNVPQPDILMMIERGGQSRLDADGYVAGAPELVAEIAADRASIEGNAKMEAYRRNGVREYLIGRVSDAALDWHILRDGQYAPLAPGADGVLRSETFPGLWLDAASLLQPDLPRVLAVLQQGLASPEHATFVGQLNQPVP
jgi:Uma2 family endonuclease